MAYTNFPPDKPLKKILAYAYTFWVIFWFVFIYIFIYPIQWWYLRRVNTKAKAHHLNRIWAKILFPILGMPLKVEYEFNPKVNGTYVFVSNHFSYWDIASLGLIINNYFAFIGKMSVKKIPFIGTMFLKLHIAVDRSEKESRAKSLLKSMAELQNGRSLMVFSEGGIVTQNPQKMVKPFKDGAFQMAINTQTPIVPVTLYNNHEIIWHDDSLFWPKTIKAKVHEPISTKGMSIENLDSLRECTWNIIQNELDQYHSKIVS